MRASHLVVGIIATLLPVSVALSQDPQGANRSKYPFVLHRLGPVFGVKLGTKPLGVSGHVGVVYPTNQILNDAEPDEIWLFGPTMSIEAGERALQANIGFAAIHPAILGYSRLHLSAIRTYANTDKFPAWRDYVGVEVTAGLIVMSGFSAGVYRATQPVDGPGHLFIARWAIGI